MPEQQQPHLQIGEIAERTGVTQRTLRFYEEKGLLAPPSRLEGGFRLYSEEDVRRVERIKELQALLGFSLADIKEMLEADDVKMQLRAEYRPDMDVGDKIHQLRRAIEVTEGQATLIRQKLLRLQEMDARLEEKLGRYRGWISDLEKLAGHGPVVGARDAFTEQASSR
jgi:DNA-binding transcriptional MerR regulator